MFLNYECIYTCMGPVLNTIIGAAIKLTCNLLNAWLEQKRQDQLALAARDDKMLTALIESQRANSGDGFVKATRRVCFYRLLLQCVF